MYAITKRNDDITIGVMEFVCDKVEDLDSLPPRCSPGSTAVVLEEGNAQVYMKNTEGKWVKL